jgi:preprotein translocase subunit SecD
MDWNRWKHPIYLLLVFAATVGSFFIIYDVKNSRWNIKFGLDLRSGSRIVVQLKAPETDPNMVIDKTVVDRTAGVFERRLNPTGAREVIIQPEGVGRVNRLIIELPEVTDVEWAERQVKAVARLEFKEQRYNPKTRADEWITVMDGTSIRRADFTTESRGATTIAVVTFEMTPDGTKAFGELTTRLVGKPLGIFFDKKMYSSPNVNEPITQGRGQISPITAQAPGQSDINAAKEMADLLNAGALPVDVEILSSMTVSPTLGAQSLRQSLMAGGIGLLLVVVFMLVYYKVPGVTANIALVVYTLLTLATMVLFDFVLTLPGIAGFVLSIGMAVDANVLIFERLKEELWTEKGLHSAVETGFNRAFSSILDGHVTTFIGAAILYYIASGTVKGFGLTLMLGTAWSMITAVYFTRVFMEVLVDSRLVTNRKLYGA